MTYWRTAVADAGFGIETVLEHDNGYAIIVGTVGDSSTSLGELHPVVTGRAFYSYPTETPYRCGPRRSG